MANSLVIRKGTNLEKRSRALRAAQYVRMSTELQRYSIENQAAAIAAYAQNNNLTIVRTYRDEGRSGLRIKGRPGLAELIEDVESGRADFDHILVYDVSRWGRFQDVDEGAHYEFVCKQNGVRIAYCAEQFDNDGSLLSSIVKNIKRVMAAEFSRELSTKVHAGLCRIASLGYRPGGPTTFGLYRELIDENERPKGRLRKGDRKSLKTDRVRLQCGSDEEVAIIRWIFHQFVNEQKTSTTIARQLNLATVANHHGRPWTENIVRNILANENYIGTLVYNRTSKRLGQTLTKNSSDMWVRGDTHLNPIVDKGLFVRAQALLAQRYVSLPEEKMLTLLRVTLSRKGKLSTDTINNTPGMPSASSYFKHFGSLRKAYSLIGYKASRDCNWIDCRDSWSDVLARHKSEAAEALRSEHGLRVSEAETGFGLKVSRKLNLSFVVVRRMTTSAGYVPRWRVYLKSIPAGLVAVARLDSKNRTIQDYVLLPVSQSGGAPLWLSNLSLARQNATRFATYGELICAVKKSLAASSRVEPTKPARPSKRGKTSRPKAKCGRALR